MTHSFPTRRSSDRLPSRGEVSDAIVISEDALQSLEGRDVVFVRTNQGFRAQKVTIGRRSAGRVEVLSGLKPGQMIATQNAFLLTAAPGKGAGEEEYTVIESIIPPALPPTWAVLILLQP